MFHVAADGCAFVEAGWGHRNRWNPAVSGSSRKRAAARRTDRLRSRCRQSADALRPMQDALAQYPVLFD
ncbi:MAG: hypothetical protein J7507_05495, partial [Pseudoxanthomonas sp.]|nr:hypothetical protein [Pseudoxanthomonas sp.]